MLKVVEIFYSIQGEGTQVGVPSIFIRLHGCNLSCSFCDEELHKGAYEELSFEAVLERIQTYLSMNVIITGGEPTLYDLRDFIAFLQGHGYFVAVETNGFRFSHIANANWITYSPKEWNHIAQEGFHEVKFVVGKNAPLEKILEFKSDKPIFIQPQNESDKPNFENVAFCVEFVKKYPRFILSVQLHKFLGVE
ncbi:7-carboxy-7-deazaguanine synthase QueE [Sulfurospirillum barnesii]|uniref:7-carboxy-7-deazaguanine synthase n=1 Tax=Sulfurospirillum barnesii (strain ATCC 700032 / DSM 10660 / SES-3) TaxID=760154 RepID=I3XZ86_SULBS|nr:7-carboxy-7-deazaguanine synthase QueE [Sulfurospirillum barnesii]AFL69260.1 organic radical activating enzyme [Sulfurospirillum barnesii SES-3]